MHLMHRLVLRWLLLIAMLAPVLALAQSPAGPSAQTEWIPGPLVVLRAGHGTQLTRVPPPPGVADARPQTATINVTFDAAFPLEARAAFQAAVDIWETEISSPVPIEIAANWVPLPGPLGSARPTYFVRNFSGAPIVNTFYPIALANKLAGRDLLPGTDDIEANFDSGFTNWYFGTDGNPPLDKYDFMSVVLHELGHGLGFAGSMQVVNGNGRWGSGNPPLPLIFDRFAVNGAGQSLIDTNLFPNPSPELAAQLTSGNVAFNGPNANAANGGTPPRLYAPNPWNQGSSFSHLDENSFPAGDVNSLMTPTIYNGEAVHDPGPITRGIFQDMGWSIDLSNRPITGLRASNNGPTNLGNPTTLSATITGGTDVSYVWDFGDGTTGRGAAVAHTYTASGTFTATVTASNARSSATASTTVQILPSSITGMIDSSGGTLTTPDGTVQIQFPSGAVNTTVIVTYTALLAPNHALPTGTVPLRSFLLEARTNTGVPVTRFDLPFRITIQYTSPEIQARDLNEESLSMVSWEGDAWVDLLPCAGCGLDTANNRLIVLLNYTGEFAAAGQQLERTFLPLIRS